MKKRKNQFALVRRGLVDDADDADGLDCIQLTLLGCHVYGGQYVWHTEEIGIRRPR